MHDNFLMIITVLRINFCQQQEIISVNFNNIPESSSNIKNITKASEIHFILQNVKKSLLYIQLFG